MDYYCPRCDRRATMSRYSPYGPSRPTRCKNSRCKYDSTTGDAIFYSSLEKTLRDDLAREAEYIFTLKVITEGVEIPTGLTPTDAYRERIQTQGKANGCHSCGKKAATDKDQPWVGDHVPSTGLSSALQDDIRKKKAIADGKTHLFPHCHPCSHAQAQVVRTHGAAAKLSAVPSTDRKYLVGTKAPTAANCIDATGETVTASQGDEIQRLGVANGCHCCGTRYPAPDYHADHVFPREFCTSYMEQLFKALGLAYPSTFYLMPQCVKCSSNQGGTLTHLAKRAQRLARDLRIAVYK